MPRSKNSDEMEFGSDSFLDVTANIVGILIILIVVAGIKAGAAPVSAARLADYIRTHVPATQAKRPAAPATTSSPAAKQVRVIPPSPALKSQADALHAELAALQADSQSAATGVDQADLQVAEVNREIAGLHAELAADSAALNSENEQIAAAKDQLERQKTTILQLEVDVQQAERQKPPAQTMRHKLTPLSREIQGKELHFRLLNNRVVFLPIEELMERLQPEMTRHRETLIRDRFKRGQVGPIAGFRLDYALAVRRLSVIDEVRRGTGLTIAVSGWELIPEPDLDTETAEEALKPGSDFLRVLGRADADTTVTLWVYPDSYELYRRIQEFAHHENFTVAARPLPFGVAISGSPAGSRSSGQ